MPLEPGVKDFDPDMAQTQLREAAEEFATDYRDPGLWPLSSIRVARLALIPAWLTRPPPMRGPSASA